MFNGCWRTTIIIIMILSRRKTNGTKIKRSATFIFFTHAKKKKTENQPSKYTFLREPSKGLLFVFCKDSFPSKKYNIFSR